MKLRIHSLVECTTALGPGVRAGIWVQGCTRGCPGCFNPETHDPGKGKLREVSSLINWVMANTAIEGVSISGGEPLDQLDPVMELVEHLSKHNMSVLLFTGYTFPEVYAITKMERRLDLLHYLDVLVCGPYRQEKHLGLGLRGSENQQVLLLSNRYSRRQLFLLPDVEFVVDRSGNTTTIGMPPEEAAK